MNKPCLYLVAALAALTATARSAQTYPAKPVTIIVPFAAGGATDTLTRFLGEKIRERLNQPIIIENVLAPPARSALGRAAHTTADGYTLERWHLDHAHAHRRLVCAAVRPHQQISIRSC